MSALIEARALDRAEPLLLLEITLSGAGAPVLYLAERDMEAGSIWYESYLWSVEGPEWKLDRSGSSGLSCSLVVRILNEPWRGYSRLLDVGVAFPFEGASISLKETYIGSDGLPTPPVTLLNGQIDKASTIDLIEFKICASSLWGSARIM